MKRTVFLLLFIPMLLAAQNVTTETTRNRFTHHDGPASTDTISTTSRVVKFLVGVVINTSVASDSIYICQSTDTIAVIRLGSTAPANPIFVPYHVVIDSPFVIISRIKTSDVTSIWRTRP